MKLRLTIAFLGNLIDMVATLWLVSLGYHEANPVMRWLLNYPILFVTVKLGLMAALLCYLWHERENKLAVIASWIAAVVYGAISIYYCVWFIIIISSVNIY